LVEGKAIQLHPLTCTGFNADFDGDQMAVHVPLGHAAILEAQLLMLAPHNILNPANGAPIAVPSQDMVLGLYYLTKLRRSTPEQIVRGEGMTFYSDEEVNIAYNEGIIDLHAPIKIKGTVRENKELVTKMIETTVGRVIFNQYVPKEVGFINVVLTKKSLRDIIGDLVKTTGIAVTAEFLDNIKDLGFKFSFKGGLSFNISDIPVPDEKESLVALAKGEVEEVWSNYNNGFITNNERYNQVIDIWTRVNSKVSDALIKKLTGDNQGFNPIFMMLDSGARGSKEQIRQLGGMRGLMAKPQKKVGGGGGEIIENPILSNFKDGLSVLEYFISTHGARKGLADTALKTADAGYLTRRLHDVAQDVVISIEDCNTLRGIEMSALKDNEEVVESLYERILGRSCLYDIINPLTGELICEAGSELTEDICEQIENSPIEVVEIRSVLTCESKNGVCVKCYGRNLSSGRVVQIGESVGVIAAQSIGEPGTQLTLRTFHTGGAASGVASESTLYSKFGGRLEFDGVKTVKTTDDDGNEVMVVIGRSGEVRILDEKDNEPIISMNIPYGAHLLIKDGQIVAKGDEICKWDPFNAVIVSDVPGKVLYKDIVDGLTYREEIDEQTGHVEKVMIESKDKKLVPVLELTGKGDEVIKEFNLPVGAHIVVENGEKIKVGTVLVKIPRTLGKTGDITGGLPRVTELFEARNPSNPAIVSEIEGIVFYGGIKRGNREITIESKEGLKKKYLVPLSKHILVQDGDFIKAGYPLSDGAITPQDILSIQGPGAVQRYILNGIQEVYRLQGVKINDKHIEVIVRQMMQKVQIVEPGDTKFLEGEYVEKLDFKEENDWIYDQKVVVDAGDSETLKPGQIVSLRRLRDENSVLRRKDLRIVSVRDAVPATSSPLLMGITRSSLGTYSWLSAASFQETTKVLNEAAIAGKVDLMLGLKENVITGHLIPAGTGMRTYQNLVVGSREEYDLLMASKEGEKEEVMEEATSN
jgi:DNA-directed RNA polymerase subunit beta'